MSKYEIAVSAHIIATFFEEPTDDEVIAYLREDPKVLFLNLEVDNVEKIGDPTRAGKNNKMKKPKQIIEFYPNVPFKVWCDGEVLVIKDMEDRPLFSRRLEHGKIRFYPKVDKKGRQGG